MNCFKTVEGTAESVTVIERSKFICTVKGVKDEEDAKNFVETIRKKHSLATHNCYAYIADETGITQKFSDDGEPQGTAGAPILNVLKNKGLKKVCAVVTRYFGGIKLGAGGLTRAYGGAVVSALDNAKTGDFFEADILTVTMTYPQYKKFSAINDENIVVRATEYGERVGLTLTVKTAAGGENAARKLFDELYKGELKPKVIGKDFFAF